MSEKSNIGLIGLAVMGENLVLNMESNGFSVSVFNRTVNRVEAFLKIRYDLRAHFICDADVVELVDTLA